MHKSTDYWGLVNRAHPSIKWALPLTQSFFLPHPSTSTSHNILGLNCSRIIKTQVFNLQIFSNIFQLLYLRIFHQSQFCKYCQFFSTRSTPLVRWKLWTQLQSFASTANIALTTPSIIWALPLTQSFFLSHSFTFTSHNIVGLNCSQIIKTQAFNLQIFSNIFQLLYLRIFHQSQFCK
jgi:hypothetical protein